MKGRTAVIVLASLYSAYAFDIKSDLLEKFAGKPVDPDVYLTTVCY